MRRAKRWIACAAALTAAGCSNSTVNKRTVRIDGAVGVVPLTKGYVAVIDAADVDLVRGRSWQAVEAGRCVYAATTIGGKRVYLHRHLTAAPTGVEVDHRDGNGLDCRRSNIRIATPTENRQNKGLTAQNRSGLKGASWNANAGKWEANIRAAGKRHYLGLFETALAAHEAYAHAARDLHGDFARVA